MGRGRGSVWISIGCALAGHWTGNAGLQRPTEPCWGPSHLCGMPLHRQTSTFWLFHLAALRPCTPGSPAVLLHAQATGAPTQLRYASVLVLLDFVSTTPCVKQRPPPPPPPPLCPASGPVVDAGPRSHPVPSHAACWPLHPSRLQQNWPGCGGLEASDPMLTALAPPQEPSTCRA